MPPTLRVTTQNLWGGAPLWSLRRRALVRALAPHTDILLMQEVRLKHRRPSQAHQLAESLHFPHVAFVEAGPVFNGREGLAIAARYPITHLGHAPVPQDQSDWRDKIAPRLFFRAVVETPLGPIAFVVIHLSLFAAARTRYAADLTPFLAEHERLAPAFATVLAGDFNVGPGDPALAAITATRGFSDAFSGQRRTATYPALFPLRRLDYLLISPTLHVISRRRIASLGSDHAALTATLQR